MKKFYTLALAAAMAFGATAAAPQVQKTLAPLPEKALQKIELAGEAVVSAQKATLPAMRKAATAEQVFGEYVWKYFCPIGQGSNEEDRINLEAGKNPNDVVITGFAGDFEVAAVADFEAGTVTIEPQVLAENYAVNAGGQQLTANIYFLPYYIGDDDEFYPSEEPVVMNITADGAVMDEMKGFAIAALSLDGKELYGYFNFCFFNEFEKYIDSNYWTPVGDAEFKAGFIYAMFVGGEGLSTIETIPAATVPAYRSVEDPNIIRLNNAYAAPFDDPTMADPMLIDLTDPNCVVVPMQYTGIGVRDMGAAYILSRSENYESIDAFLASDMAKYVILLKDSNVIDIPAGGIWWFFPEGDPEHLYGAKNELPSRITLPAGWNAIDNITVEGVDAPVEYYNLQGIRVANPESGLYIRRQGKKAVKVIL